MFILANLLSATAAVLNILLTVYLWVIIARAVISWVNPDPYNPIVRFLYSATEPVLRPVRSRLPMGMGLDLSPLIVIAAIYFARIFIVNSLVEIAHRLQ